MVTKFRKTVTSIEGLFIIEPLVFNDSRGFFFEFYNKREFAGLGLHINFVQDNHSRSTRGVLRGLHFQEKYPQGKLVRVVKGSVYDVGIDLRKKSPTYGHYFGIELSEVNRKMLYLPEGFAHGFLVISETAELMYKVTDYYYPQYDKGIIWNDPAIAIQWPLEKCGMEAPVLSAKDAILSELSEIISPFDY